MSESNSGVVTARELPISVPKPPASSHPVIHNMRLTYKDDGTAVLKPVAPPPPKERSALTEILAAPVPLISLLKQYIPKKLPALTLPPPPVENIPQLQLPHSATSPIEGSTYGSLIKRRRGRPPRSSKRHQMELLGSKGTGFRLHTTICVQVGEDVLSRIMSFSQNGPRTICIVSASGAVSRVTLRHGETSNGTATYEGKFDILSLSGSFLPSEVGQRTNGLVISLASANGQVLGGCVAGPLVAASPVQVMVGSFIAEHRETVANYPMKPFSAQ